MKIHVNFIRAFLVALIAMTITMFLSYNLLFSYSNKAVKTIENMEDLAEAKSLNKSDTLLEIKGTPNELFKIVGEENDVYFSLKEYGNSIVIKDSSEANLSLNNYKGNFDEMRFVANSSELLAKLNTPINLNEELDTNLNLTEAQTNLVSNLTQGEFNDDTIVIFTKHSDTNNLMKIFLESIGIFLCIFAAFGVVFRILKFDHEYWDFHDEEPRRRVRN